MAIRNILTVPEETEFLHKKSREVNEIDQKIITLLDDMKETLYASGGIGLAAPQIGILRRVVVIDLGDHLYELINPKIVYKKGEQINAEGCLSAPGRSGTVARPQKVIVRAQNRSGEEYEIHAEELLAICLCHEIDHLDGILYLDKMIAEVENE